jgi:hypothetical protein
MRTLIIFLQVAFLAAQIDPLLRSERPELTPKVLVLNFDPFVQTEAGMMRLHAACGWNDPAKLAKEYIQDVAQSSGGYVQYKIVEWLDLDEFPQKADGFRYSAISYMKCRQDNAGWHQPDGVAYKQIVERFEVPRRVDAGELDEVWFFGAPYFGFWESTMAGKGAYWCNSPPVEGVDCSKIFVVMGFNYERGVAEMLHDLCHRTESILSHVYGGWEADKLTTNWARFAANAKQSGGVAAVGSCHYPPNAESDYDYANSRSVQSSADDWLNYPRLTGATKPVTRETWGGPDYHRNYMKWWFGHVPKAPGRNEDGKLNNWWEYIINFNAYIESRGK